MLHSETGLLVEEHVVHTKEITALVSSDLIPGVFVSGDKIGRVVVTSTSACLGLDARDRGTPTPNSTTTPTASTPSVTREMRPGSDSCVSCLATSPYEAAVVVVGYESGALVVVDIRACTTLRRLAGHTRGVQSVAWMPPSYRTMVNDARRELAKRIGVERRESTKTWPRRRSRRNGGVDDVNDAEEKEEREETEEERRLRHGKLVYAASELHQLGRSTSAASSVIEMPSFVLEETAGGDESPPDLDAVFVTSSRDRSIRLW